MFISPAYAQAAGGGGGSDFIIQLLPLVLIFVVFYFLIIRPQQKKVKDHKAMVEALKRGEMPKPGPQNGRLSSEPLGGATTLTTFNPAASAGGNDD